MLVFLTAAARAWFISANARDLCCRTARGAIDRLCVNNGFDLARFGRGGIGHIADVLCPCLNLLRGIGELIARLHANCHEHARDLVLDTVQQLTEQLKRLALVFLLGLLLRVTP